MARESTVYRCTFFREMESDGFFHVSEDYQYDLLYWLLHPGLFHCRRFSIIPFHGLSFCIGFATTILINVLSTCKHFYTKTFSSEHITHSSVNFTWFVLLSQLKINDRLLFEFKALWFSTILNRLKENIFVRLKSFLL